MGVLNSPSNAERPSDDNGSGARKAVLCIEPAEVKLQRVAILSLVEPRTRIATITVSHPSVEIKPPLYALELTSTGQPVCPRCGSLLFNLKLLNRNYCFKCKTYV